MKRLLIAISLISLLASGVHAQTTPVPSLMNFQGRLAKPDGTPVTDGNYSIKFTIFDAASGGAERWTQTMNPVLVRNGAFAVLLGNGNPLTDSVFNGNIWLEIQVGADAPLSPRQQIVSVPFAVKANTANTVPDGAITTAKIADGAVTTVKVANAAITLEKLAAGVLFWEASGNNIYNTNTDNVGIGTTNPQARLDVNGTARMTGFQLTTGATNNYVLASNASGIGTWQSVASLLGVAGGDLTGNYPDPLIGNAKVTAAKIADAAVTTAKINDLAVTTGKIADLGVATGKIADLAVTGAKIADLAIATGKIADSAVTSAKIADATITSADLANLAITNAKLADGSVTTLKIVDANVTSPKIADGAITAAKIAANAVGNIQLASDGASLNKVSGGAMTHSGGNIGIGTAAPTAKLEVNGAARVQVIEVLGGSDVAEPYHVAPAGNVQPIPGMVVSIDPKQVGRMKVSSRAYDKAVAGILSGANGIQPGLTLRQKGTVADGALPVASVGRVWCWCDADVNGPITPGDSLTSSPTPGHAMKVTRFSRANGAILGKAMSSLARGKGLVLTLITLK